MSKPVPGLLLVSSRIKKSRGLTPEVFSTWYNTVHAPDFVATSGINAGFRYQHADPQGVTHPNLTLYPLPDVAFVQSSEVLSVPLTHAMLPGVSHDIMESVEIVLHVYIHEKSYEAASTKPGTISVFGSYTFALC